MSSDYNILCVSHDPAILIETEISRPDEAIEKVLHGLPDHPACDLLIGRYSYPLVEVCCVGGDATKRHHSGWHRDPIWADAGLVRVAALALKRSETDPEMAEALRRLPMCWTPDRLRRIRVELGVTDNSPNPPEAGRG